MALHTPFLSAFCVLQGAILTTMLATRNFSGRCCLRVPLLQAELGKLGFTTPSVGLKLQLGALER